MLFDSHCHLNDRKLYENIDQVLEDAHAAGVGRILDCGYDWKSSLMAVRQAEQYPDQVYAAVGVHPHDAKTLTDALLQKLSTLCQEEAVVAWGEIGLDYYRDLSPRDVQQRAFRQQIQAAKALKMPIIIHDRDAHADILQIVREEKAGEYGGIFHCYSGSWEMAKECLNQGFMLSFAGPLTFKNANKLLEVAEKAPAESILVETDSPYLSPHPYRGQQNEPARVRLVAERLAELRGLTLEAVAALTTANACRVFGISM